MSGDWLEIRARGTKVGGRRAELQPGLTRLGGPGCEVEIPGTGADQLHVFDSPARVSFVGRGEPPRINGQRAESFPLRHGDEIEWGGSTIVFRAREAPVVEEISPDEAAKMLSARPARPAGLSEAESRMWRRYKAGLLLELGAVDKETARHWRERVISGEFAPDACADEILSSTPSMPADADTRLVERSGRLLKDFLMAPLNQGAHRTARKVRHATRNITAMAVSQMVTLLVYSALVAIALLLLRFKGVSFDPMFDRVLSLFGHDS